MDYTPHVRRLTIRSKSGGLCKLEPNWAQREFLAEIDRQETEERSVRIIVLKARQLGISTITQGVKFIRRFKFPHTNGKAVLHDTDSAEKVFAMTRLMWDRWPYKRLYDTQYFTKKEILFHEPIGSSLDIRTAKAATAGRSLTVHDLHGSEVAFWDHPGTTMLSLRQAIPQHRNTMIVLESTANGVGNYFHTTWRAAEEGDNEYKPMFFPWWRHPEYTGTAAGLKGGRLLGRLDDDERLLRKLGASDDHLKWRRYHAIPNLVEGDVEKFRQEYPGHPEEAFITTGSNVFPLEALKGCYEPLEGERGILVRDRGTTVRFVKDRTGPLRVFSHPSKDQSWGQYIVGGDATHTVQGDYAAAQVLNRRSLEQVAVWHGRMDSISFADQLDMLGHYYNIAELVPEVEGPGYATVGRLLEMGYPNLFVWRFPDRIHRMSSGVFGWSSTWKTKNFAISKTIKLLADRDLILHDKRTFEEMSTFVTDGSVFEPADPSGHDDMVMGLVIACGALMLDGPIEPYDKGATQAEVSRRLAEARQQEQVPWEEWGSGQEIVAERGGR